VTVGVIVGVRVGVVVGVLVGVAVFEQLLNCHSPHMLLSQLQVQQTPPWHSPPGQRDPSMHA
jgi:hypothetical protein